MTSDRDTRSEYAPYGTTVPPNLSPAQFERLSLLSEELGEAVQAVGKILRHGLNSTNPDGNPYVTNAMALELELGDILAAVELLCVSGDLFRKSIELRVPAKLKKVRRYLHHQPSPAAPFDGRQQPRGADLEAAEGPMPSADPAWAISQMPRTVPLTAEEEAFQAQRGE